MNAFFLTGCDRSNTLEFEGDSGSPLFRPRSLGEFELNELDKAILATTGDALLTYKGGTFQASVTAIAKAKRPDVPVWTWDVTTSDADGVRVESRWDRLEPPGPKATDGRLGLC